MHREARLTAQLRGLLQIGALLRAGASPAELYAAVAKVLAFVMSLRARGGLLGGETHALPD